jgi:putative drug exporter of the RND superfamily
MIARLAAFSTSVRGRRIVIAAWVLLALALAPLQPRLQDAASNENEAFLADSAESTEVDDLIDERFELGREVTALVVYSRPGAPLTQDDYNRIDTEMRALCEERAIPDLKSVVTPTGVACGNLDDSLAPETPASQISEDGSTALATVATTDEDTAVVVEDVATLRERLPGPDADGLRSYVTGEAGFTADASEAYEGIDRTLLAITLVLVLVLLLATYRSPLVAVVPLVTVALAYLIAAGVVFGLFKAGLFGVTGQSTAILIVLMFGAGTDYCLLLVSRYREELRAGGRREAAMARATAHSGRAIVSAGATVIVAMLVLTLADFRATRDMGPALAAGIAVMVAAGLTVLPALLSTLGPRAFHATRDRPSGTGPVWDRIAGLLRARPGAVTAVVLAVLGVGALGTLDGRGTLDFTEGFRDPPESVLGTDVVRDQFGPGRAAPAQLVVDTRRLAAVSQALDASDDVRTVTPVSYSTDEQLTLVDLELAPDPFSQAGADAIPRLRDAARAAAGDGTALIGGLTAETLDSAEAQRADAALIAPLTLVLVLLIVIALVRAVVAPLYLVGTVVLSYAFALGASSLVFTHLLGQPDSDPGLPLFAFIFLVALGVDYNIFLISRIREELPGHGTAAAVEAGLRRTGGVITSAGLILAGTFAVLMTLPVESLFQAGFTIALGVLVDTFLIRIFLVPGLALLLGDRNWWPGRVPAASGDAGVPFADRHAEVR